MKAIRIRGARTHNLKNIDVDIPTECLAVITGPSGSGKSSLAFDTLFAEGQRRYVESLSIHARQFIARLPRPDIDAIDGLPPTIAIAQQSGGCSPRSTVGTSTEIYDFLRLLFARAGTPHCVRCGAQIAPLTVDQMVDAVFAAIEEGARFTVLSPVARGVKGNLDELLKRLKKSGYVRISIDGQPHDLTGAIRVNARTVHDVDVTIDRLVCAPGIRNRLADSLELALKESGGLALVAPVEGPAFSFTSSHSCIACGETLRSLTPSSFSFNTPAGACPECSGLGEVLFFDEDKVIPDPSVSLREGAIVPWTRRSTHYYQALLDAVTTRWNIDPFAPWNKLPQSQRDIVLHGADGEIEFTLESDTTQQTFKRTFEGVLPNLERRCKDYERRSRDANGEVDGLSDEFAQYMSAAPCKSCGGFRLKPEVLSVTIDEHHISQLSAMTIERLADFFEQLTLAPRQMAIAAPLLREIRSRIGFLQRIGLSYLTLHRSTASLSGGEAQRIRIATQLGAALCGVCYVLDEPSTGLHQCDNARLLETLKTLVAQGNTVVLVEHDADTIAAADYIVDMGPGAGMTGGHIVARGSVTEIRNDPASLTGAYLSGRIRVPVPSRRRNPTDRKLRLNHVATNNLKDISVEIPLGLFVAVTGVSGSGKSSLVMDTLLPALRRERHHTTTAGAGRSNIAGAGHIDKVIHVDQSPIGRSLRSNPATFTGMFSDIRNLFAELPDSRMRGWKSDRFSFNMKGGRCAACSGEGAMRIEMSFLPDAFVTCEVCDGKKYNRETLEVQYRGRNIDDVLSMTCDEAALFFENHSRLTAKLDVLRRVGLGYLSLGQSATTLSGGEAQRLKLARELSARSTGRTLYILDEPTTGLHACDVHVLLSVLNELVDAGNTVLVVEHNLDVIKTADHVIDLGPGGGAHGGTVVASGTPEEIAGAGSPTGLVLRNVL